MAKIQWDDSLFDKNEARCDVAFDICDICERIYNPKVSGIRYFIQKPCLLKVAILPHVYKQAGAL